MLNPKKSGNSKKISFVGLGSGHPLLETHFASKRPGRLVVGIDSEFNILKSRLFKDGKPARSASIPVEDLEFIKTMPFFKKQGKKLGVFELGSSIDALLDLKHKNLVLVKGDFFHKVQKLKDSSVKVFFASHSLIPKNSLNDFLFGLIRQKLVPNGRFFVVGDAFEKLRYVDALTDWGFDVRIRDLREREANSMYQFSRFEAGKHGVSLPQFLLVAIKRKAK